MPPCSPCFILFLQGRVRPNIVKKAARQVVEKYYARCVLYFACNFLNYLFGGRNAWRR
jgi:hypothetical protein